MDDVILRFVDMPTATKAMTVLDDDGNYNIYINDRLPYDARLEAYDHEIAHIKKGHFYSSADIRVKEGAVVATGDAAAPLVIKTKPHLSEEEKRDKRVATFMRRVRKRMKEIQPERIERRQMMEEGKRRRPSNDELMAFLKTLR
jgi:hypothetical protein